MDNAPEQPRRVTWETLDWVVLDQLRARFLAREPSHVDYWKSPVELGNYDFTYAQRIGWKWDAVWSELARRGWKPPAGPLLDWGCGTGIAGRSAVGSCGASHFETLYVADRSVPAMQFAAERARGAFPGLDVRTIDPREGLPAASANPVKTMVVSHVLGELDERGQHALRAIIAGVDAVLWVEPGTYADSRALISIREALREDFRIIAPCTHCQGCGMLRAHNETHWCHHFAAPPAGLAADRNWMHFGRRAGIDLRSIPYSFLVLERRAVASSTPRPVPCEDASGAWSRVIGYPRMYKGFAKILDCSSPDVREVQLQKRDNAEVFRAFRKGDGPVVLRSRADGPLRKIVEETR